MNGYDSKTFIIPVFATFSTYTLRNYYDVCPSESSRVSRYWSIRCYHRISNTRHVIDDTIYYYICCTFVKTMSTRFRGFYLHFRLLINAIADDGYVHDFVSGNSQNFWVWDLFWIADFTKMAGALC